MLKYTWFIQRHHMAIPSRMLTSFVIQTMNSNLINSYATVFFSFNIIKTSFDQALCRYWCASFQALSIYFLICLCFFFYKKKHTHTHIIQTSFNNISQTIKLFAAEWQNIYSIHHNSLIPNVQLQSTETVIIQWHGLPTRI